MNNNSQKGEDDEEEWSSLIFEIDFEGNKYYGYTDAVQWYDSRHRWRKSPGLLGKDHHPLPKKGKLVGVIHLHWKGSERLDKRNEGFSARDKRDHTEFTDKYFYVLGAKGVLLGKSPNNTINPNDPELPRPLLDNGYTPKPKILIAANPTQLKPCFIPAIIKVFK